MELDEYIQLKGRVESRMKATVLTSTGDDNLLSDNEKRRPGISQEAVEASAGRSG